MTLPLPSVMLVDDHPLFRQGLRMMLSSSNMLQADIHEAGSVTDAVAQEHWVNLVMLDISMPGCDGLEATRSLRAMGCEVPIVALTANAMTEDRARCLAQGMNDFLAKPISLARLRSCLLRHCRLP